MREEVIFEESLSDEWAGDLEMAEVSLTDRPLFWAWIAVFVLGLTVVGRVFFLGVVRGETYRFRAKANLSQEERIPAPRGLIADRFGEELVENRPVFSAVLNVREFLKERELQERTLRAAAEIVGLTAERVLELVKERNIEETVEPIVLRLDLNQSQVIALRALNLPTLSAVSGFERQYRDGPFFASIVGYTGFPTSEDLKCQPELSGRDFVGKTGLEAFYDQILRGQPGVVVKLRDAKGDVLGEEKQSDPQAGRLLALTIDGEFQRYFASRLREGFSALGRTSGVGLAMNPQNGEILALLSFPLYDNNVFSDPGKSDERQEILNDPSKPLFNRAVSGLYAPGSTIKPLTALAALAEGVTDPERTIFSPGYVDVPNPYDPGKPTRFLDWRYQGRVDLSAAIAQSSNVYFYFVGGGSPKGIEPAEVLDGGGYIQGLGITRLREWWQRLGLGLLTGIDLPGEKEGFLPSAEWKERRDPPAGGPWLLGDTYNVAIGQGDLLVTPLQLLSYIAGIANGGKILKPVINREAPHPEVLADLSHLGPALAEIRRGMREAVTAPLGTANRMADLPLAVAGKTGSAQILNNQEENAFFVGYAPADNPEIAVLVLVEKAVQGSLNAVPIAKDVLSWYYWNRIKIRK